MRTYNVLFEGWACQTRGMIKIENGIMDPKEPLLSSQGPISVWSRDRLFDLLGHNLMCSFLNKFEGVRRAWLPFPYSIAPQQTDIKAKD